MHGNFKRHVARMAVFILAGIAALGYLVMVLWNWLLPQVLPGAAHIDYLQALGVLLLSRILFGGFRGHGHARWHRQRWESLTPEEREKFRTRMHRCGSRHGSGEAAGGEGSKDSAAATVL